VQFDDSSGACRAAEQERDGPVICESAQRCYGRQVIVSRIFVKLLTAVALLGMLLAPFAPGAVAMSIAAHATADMSMMKGGSMPCCPDEAPAESCAKSCPLMAMCVNQALPAQPGFILQTFEMQPIKLVAANDAPLDGRAENPPPKPPKLFT